MANERLHLICGNCGCNNEWSYKIVKDGIDIDGELFDCIDLTCNNCSTNHTIDYYMKNFPYFSPSA